MELNELHWYAYYTRARHEQRVETRLNQLGFESFLPKMPMLRQWKDRKKMVDWPLFPGYIFIHCHSRDIAKILGTTGVVSVVYNNGRPAPVNPAELDNVRLLIKSLSETGGVPERVPLEPGLAVRVTDGPLKGVEGVVIKQRNKKKFIVQLTTIGEGLVVNVDDSLLEAQRDRYGNITTYEAGTYAVSVSTL